MDERKLKVLALIATTYTATGEPVGSKLLTELLDNAVSSATIRNDMSALFEMGLLEQPHTSAGRIPSHLGFRMYIDELMHTLLIEDEHKDRIDAFFNVRNPDPEQLLEQSAGLLAEITGCAAISSTITPPTVKVKRIDVIPVGDTTVCILIVTSNGVVKSCVCRVDFLVTSEIVEFFRKFAASNVVGKNLREISQQYLNMVSISLGEYSRVFTPLFAAIYELCREIFDGQYYISGTNNLLKYPEYKNSAYDLLQFIAQKDEMLELIGPADIVGTRVYIGRENHIKELTNSSIIITKYDIGRHTTGALGIIGPVRLNYAKAIPYVEYFAQKLAELLSETYESIQE